MLPSCSLGGPLVSGNQGMTGEAKLGSIPKIRFRPSVAKEASIFTAEASFLVASGTAGQVLRPSGPQDVGSLPGVSPGPRFRKMQNS